jgi:hypothetical protein
MEILSLLRLIIKPLTFWILLLNIYFNIPFLRYMIFMLIIYGSIISIRSHKKIAKYYKINSNLLYLGHIISHYLIPFYFLYNNNFYNKPLHFKQYIYGILFAYAYYILIDIKDIYFIDNKKIQIEVFILWTIIYILSNLI